MNVELKDIALDPAKFREARGDLALTKVAEIIGITKQKLWNYENGKGDPPSDILIKLCLVYEKPIEYFSTASKNFSEMSTTAIDY